jgi:hypothetical protein
MHPRPRDQKVRARPARIRGSACGGRQTLIAAGVLVAVAASASCSGGSGGLRIADSSATPSTVTSAPVVAPGASARQQVIEQYDAFWSHVPQASRAPATRRRAILAPFAVDPELTSLLQGMATQDVRGEVIYGTNIPRPTVKSLSEAQGVAVVTDCQDSSHSGVERRSDHRLLTVGVARNPVVATMQRDGDGTWRVSFVSYPNRSC